MKKNLLCKTTLFVITIIFLNFSFLFSQNNSQGKILQYSFTEKNSKKMIKESHHINYSVNGISVEKDNQSADFIFCKKRIPLKKVEYFFSFSCKVSGKNLNSKNVSFKIRFSKNGKNWSEWNNINQSDDIETTDTLNTFISELYFFSKDLKYFQFSGNILNPADSIFISGVKLNFFNPSKKNESNRFQNNGGQSNFQSVCPCPLPSYTTRAGWGAVAATCSPTYTTVTHLIVHHQGQPSPIPIPPPYDLVVQSIQYYHMNTNGWCDIGYNWLIDPVGQLYEGIGGGNNVMGSHFSCMNTGTMGVCILDNYDVLTPSSASLNTLEQLLAWKCCDAGIPAIGTAYHAASGLTLNRISGHRDANPSLNGCPSGTTCPGDNLYNQLSTIRSATDLIISNCNGAGCSSSNPLASDICTSATFLNPGGTSCNPSTYTTCGATNSGFSSCVGNSDDDVFFYFFAPNNGDYCIEVDGSSTFRPVFQVLLGPCGGSMSQVTCQDAGSLGGVATYTLTATGGVQYWIRVWNYGSGSGSTGDFDICAYSCNSGSVSLAYSNQIIHDGTGGGTGNSNGIAEVGEEIDIEVELYNSGNADAHNVSAILTTTNPNITITDDTEGFPDINAGSSEWTNGDFDFTISNPCTTGNVNFSLNISSDEGTWTDNFSVFIDCSTVSVNEIPRKSHILIFPNPTNELLNIKIEGLSNENLEIILSNVLEQQIQKKCLKVSNDSFETKMSVKELSNGIYFIVVKTNDYTFRRKIIKE